MAGKIMDALVASEVGAAQQATMVIISVGDLRMAAPLIDAVRAAQIGMVRSGALPGYLFALQMIAQQMDITPTWAQWTAWYAEQDITPPPGYTAWKGRLLSRIDPKLGALFENDPKHTIRIPEIVWGGVKFDGIPALNQPKVSAAADATYLDDSEPVFGLVIHGQARAYPQRLLDWHEMVNDTLGSVPVALAYCTLGGAAIAYDGRITLDGQPQTLTFGSSGLLYRSNKLMFDHASKTLWNQLTGKPVMGSLVGKDLRLTVLPLVVTRWGDWKADHPQTTVLSANTGFDRNYTLGAAYGTYFASPGVMFPIKKPSDALALKARVFVLRRGDKTRVYPVTSAVRQKVIADLFDDTPVIIVATRADIEVTGQDLRTKSKVTFNVGAEVRAFAGRVKGLTAGRQANELTDADGNVWRITDQAIIGPDGTDLPRLPGHLAYWWAISTQEPEVSVYTASEVPSP